jgi:hypothetical protein
MHSNRFGTLRRSIHVYTVGGRTVDLQVACPKSCKIIAALGDCNCTAKNKKQGKAGKSKSTHIKSGWDGRFCKYKARLHESSFFVDPTNVCDFFAIMELNSCSVRNLQLLSHFLE